MVKLNLKQKLFTLQGKVVTTQNDDGVTKRETYLGEVLANIILAPNKTKKGFRPLPAWELAQKLIKEEKIELDNSVVVQIKDLLEDSNDYFPFVIAQVQEAIINAEKETK